MTDTTRTTTGLAHYDAACTALAAAASIDEVKTILDKSTALQVYARQAKDRRLIADATRITERATRKIGELMREKRDAGLMAKGTRGQLAGPGVIGGTKKDPPINTETLLELGIDKHLAAAARSRDKMSDAQFESHVERKARLAAAVIDGDSAVIKESEARLHAEKAARRASIERALGDKIRALPDIRYGVIYADPPWRFEVHAESGKTHVHPENHYPTCALDDIKALDVPSLAADDAVLFLWATVPMLPHALETMKAWGFEYRSNIAWVKDRTGTGFWALNRHEHLLIGVKGNPPAPMQGELAASAIEAPRGRHSEKPECFAQLIEAYYPNMPKIELYARGPARPGWTNWGNEAEEASAVA